MGWTFTPGWNRRDQINDCIKGWDLHGGPDDKTVIGRNETLRWCTVGNVLWSVCEARHTAGPKAGKVERWIRCDLLQNGGEDGWGVKSMEESCGPYHHSCPASYLDMVPCPDSEYARNWRKTVLEIVEIKRSRAKLAAGLKNGDKVYILGHKDPFTFEREGRHMSIWQGRKYRLPVNRIDVQRTLKARETTEAEVPLGV